MDREWTLDRLLDLVGGPASLEARVGPLDWVPSARPDEIPPLIVDESDNLIDGYHRLAGIYRWVEQQGLSATDVTVPVIVVPDEVGERLFGHSVSEEEYDALVADWGEQS